MSHSVLLLPVAALGKPMLWAVLLRWLANVEVLWHALFSSCMSTVIPGVSQPFSFFFFSLYLCICFLHRACPVYLCKHLFCSTHCAIEIQHSLFNSSSLNLCRVLSELGWGVMSDIPGVPSVLRTTCWELQLWLDQTEQHQKWCFSVVYWTITIERRDNLSRSLLLLRKILL